jgi:hypothetical protein
MFLWELGEFLSSGNDLPLFVSFFLLFSLDCSRAKLADEERATDNRLLATVQRHKRI